MTQQKPTEYTIAYKNPEGKVDIIYNIFKKSNALKEAKKLFKEGCREIWIDIHVDDDIVGDINFDKLIAK